MKIIKTFALVLMAALSFSLVSCETEIDNLIPQEGNYVTVNLGIGGEYIELAETPLETRADENYKEYISDVYLIQVYTITESGMRTPYASGSFRSLDALSIKLLEGSKYDFVASIITDVTFYAMGENGDYWHSEYGGQDTQFNYSNNYVIDQLTSIWNGYNLKKERFFGELNGYSPSEDALVKIDTKRTSYGAHFIADGLTEGSLDIQIRFQGYNSSNYISLNLTPETPEYNGIFSFSDQQNAWRGSHDMPTNTYVDYYDTKQININWIKADGSTTPMGTYDVTFKRNVKTTIRISVEEVGVKSGIVLTREDVPMVNDDKEYLIEGGKVTEVPVRDQI